eukprot:TRINITY_DN12631_c0_g1_i14.p1 TRINITY_DN12631_c0_g1~~TRINITY_DN12631_c0_g1_i14.p1  ORF type:complete len:178 (-),score=51.08 TRINITY_DN12631_c0_g1_i14:411-944(-)
MNILDHLHRVSPQAQGFIRGCLEAGRSSSNLTTSPSPSPQAKATDVVQTYTSRLAALQEKYGFKAEGESAPLPAATIATSASLQEAAAKPVNQVADQYQDRLRQLQKQYGIQKEESGAATVTAVGSSEKAGPNLDSIRARMQKLDSSGLQTPEPTELRTASSIDELKARLNKVKSTN